MTHLRLILGDQLSPSLSSLKGCDPEHDIILMCELWDEATYAPHHKKKIAFIFSAMRHFAQELKDKGFRVIYIPLDDSSNTGSFQGEVLRHIAPKKAHGETLNNIERVIVTHPSEYRVLLELKDLQNKLPIPMDILEDDRFLCRPDAFAAWADGRKQLRMEYFYRLMRKDYNVLMDGPNPVGGQWNYDADNRKPPKTGLAVPAPYQEDINDVTAEVMRLVAERFSDHFGDLEPFHFAVTREGALRVLQHFIDERLNLFGDYQDAMLQGEPWMYHAHIGLYLNCGLLQPLECVNAAQKAYETGRAPLNAVEGFIRQIMGWREYIRGIYWLKMPGYASQNALQATRNLPEFYWTGQTQMNCLRQCVLETKHNAYAHHIQRLMVLGNFALLAGLSPNSVNEWFLSVYADAYEWVELPNVSGMVLFADDGYLASKPYAAGGAYINKMSNYCKQCRYKVTKKNGAEACPFNYLYWDFLERNRSKFGKNPRLGMVYRTYDKMDADKQRAITEDSARFFLKLEAGDDV